MQLFEYWPVALGFVAGAAFMKALTSKKKKEPGPPFSLYRGLPPAPPPPLSASQAVVKFIDLMYAQNSAEVSRYGIDWGAFPADAVTDLTEKIRHRVRKAFLEATNHRHGGAYMRGAYQTIIEDSIREANKCKK